MYGSYLDPDSNCKKKCDYYEISRNLNTDWLIILRNYYYDISAKVVGIMVVLFKIFTFKKHVLKYLDERHGV